MFGALNIGQVMEAIKSSQDELNQLKQEYKQEQANLDVRRHEQRVAMQTCMSDHTSCAICSFVVPASFTTLLI